ncbi:MAG TPA: hypothetical protein DHW82_09065 [Spirochaetia bacterium]|nr:MAG: hypothetical protein A2Y41_04300 [Spirochaetes bacterium GWB1_36_13]HCL57139.1 hypothetical protein [Spirochaetia bacterium]
MVKEKKIRSIVKAVSWRITGTLDTVMVAYFITGTFKLALSIGGLEVFTKLFIYYLHERAWTKIKFGLEKKEPEYFI